MGDFVYNISKGRAAELYNRVDTNDPANSVLLVLVYNTTATDATLRDLDTISQIEADGLTAEVTNTNYARKTLTDASISAFTPDDTNDRVDLTIPNQTWTGVAAGTGWTDIVIAYDADSTSGNDTNVTPLTQHDFVVTPDGSDITMQVNAAGFFRAS